MCLYTKQDSSVQVASQSSRATQVYDRKHYFTLTLTVEFAPLKECLLKLIYLSVRASESTREQLNGLLYFYTFFYENMSCHFSFSLSKLTILRYQPNAQTVYSLLLQQLSTQQCQHQGVQTKLKNRYIKTNYNKQITLNTQQQQHAISGRDPFRNHIVRLDANCHYSTLNLAVAKLYGFRDN